MKAQVSRRGDMIYYTNAIADYHREDGPATELISGTKQWYKNGKLHRLDGPAVIYYDGVEEYWVNGHQVRSAFEMRLCKNE